MNNNEVELLLVEDDPNDVELTLLALRKHKLANKIHVVRDGEEALDFVFSRGAYSHRTSNDPPKVILLDLKLPKINGLEVLKIIKSDPRTRAVPVVVMTSSREQRSATTGWSLTRALRPKRSRRNPSPARPRESPGLPGCKRPAEHDLTQRLREAALQAAFPASSA